MTSKSTSDNILRIVFDTNFYLAAFREGSYSEYWLQYAGSEKTSIKLFISSFIIQEVENKLRNKFTVSQPLVAEYLESILENATLVQPKEVVEAVESDPDDNKILECAVEAEAQLVVTADTDLLELKNFRGIGIAHPSDLKYIFQEKQK